MSKDKKQPAKEDQTRNPGKDHTVHTPEPPQVMNPSAPPRKNTQTREEVRKNTQTHQNR